MIRCKIFTGPHPDLAFNEWVDLHPLYKINSFTYQHVEKGLCSVCVVYDDGRGVRIGGPAPA